MWQCRADSKMPTQPEPIKSLMISINNKYSSGLDTSNFYQDRDESVSIVTAYPVEEQRFPSATVVQPSAYPVPSAPPLNPEKVSDQEPPPYDAEVFMPSAVPVPLVSPSYLEPSHPFAVPLPSAPPSYFESSTY